MLNELQISRFIIIFYENKYMLFCYVVWRFWSCVCRRCDQFIFSLLSCVLFHAVLSFAYMIGKLLHFYIIFVKIAPL